MPDAAAAPLVRVDAVSMIYARTPIEIVALERVDLAIQAGELVAISGPSGCGKSTLLGLMGLLDLPTKGDVWLRGAPTAALSPAERARLRREMLGFVFQSFCLLGNLTLLENVELPLAYRGLARRARRELAERALVRVGLGHRARHHPEELSGGQQQSAAIARAIAGSPPLVLADEPTGNLDSVSGEAVMRLLLELNDAGTAVCFVTHDPRYAQLARRQIDLFDGRIVGDRRRGAA